MQAKHESNKKAKIIMKALVLALFGMAFPKENMSLCPMGTGNPRNP